MKPWGLRLSSRICCNFSLSACAPLAYARLNHRSPTQRARRRAKTRWDRGSMSFVVGMASRLMIFIVSFLAKLNLIKSYGADICWYMLILLFHRCHFCIFCFFIWLRLQLIPAAAENLVVLDWPRQEFPPVEKAGDAGKSGKAWTSRAASGLAFLKWFEGCEYFDIFR